MDFSFLSFCLLLKCNNLSIIAIISNIIYFQAAVDKLYEFRDHYFEHFSLDQAVHKDENVEKKMHECLEKLTSLKGEMTLICILTTTLFVEQLLRLNSFLKANSHQENIFFFSLNFLQQIEGLSSCNERN